METELTADDGKYKQLKLDLGEEIMSGKKTRALLIQRVSSNISKGLTSLGMMMLRLKEISGLEVSFVQDTINKTVLIEFHDERVTEPVHSVEFSIQNSSQIDDGLQQAFRWAEDYAKENL